MPGGVAERGFAAAQGPSIGTQRALTRETPGGGLESMLDGTPGDQAEAAEIVDQALELLAQELVAGSQDFPEHLGEVCRLVVRGSPVEAYWRDDLDTMQQIWLARAGDLEVEGQG